MPAPQESGSVEVAHNATSTATADLPDGLGWLALGVAILIGSLRMDRLQSQGINPYTAPGLLPGLLAIAIILFGGLLAVRGWHRRKVAQRSEQAPARTASARLGLVLGLCLVFDIVLVGHGLPFWAAASLFVAASIFLLQRTEAPIGRPRSIVRRVGVPVIIGLAAGLVVTLVFQGIFLVHLP
jgi:hypothetical protein